MEILASFPSPSESEIHLGSIPLRGYALCIIIGVFLAIWLGGRRWVERGGRPGTVADIAVWAVPFGLIGARVYHVVTDYQLYFDEGRDWVDAFKIWDGGIGIWGAIAGGALGAWIACRRRGIALPPLADAVAPGIAFAQAIGRWGNWFNQELYGRATDVPWAVEIDNGLDNGTFHPTFLYESLWCVGVGVLVIWADRRFRLGHGRAFALYVAAYTAGRFWIEYLRIDEAHEFLGLRLNNWTSVLVFAAAVAYLVISSRRAPGREERVEAPEDEPSDAVESADAAESSEETDAADAAEAADTAETADAPAPAKLEKAAKADGAEGGDGEKETAPAEKGS
ncbi:prolipoprotein diacylglyceryl transferase [Streptomyces radicis]|uniref:Phosphatidylglycerol--prolipoprotein diacylglyceryl transferase n=1 Tax=Streptomyces radicis TaxID=1750517 RepID=A0A3A9VUB3_9ACTN|nr:prolipoprotein diacylglyceryl transferase [Streptomyces radicis]RKN04330.1 prolipoprotein diacylglyceryl transferase [Streptomyces radicis]RKN14837.1 prolipoprotein diacylglyceryl transferase [Streptomyces radicis]